MGEGEDGVDGEGAPALRFAAREGFVPLLRAEHVAWRMAGAAMADALDEIGAPVPKIVMRGIGLERPPPQEEQVPAGEHWPLVQGERQLVRRRRRMDGLAGHEECIEGVVVRVRYQCEMVIGEGWIEMATFAVDAFAHGASEGLFRPAADAGLGIGRDVGRIDRAERRRQRQPASEGLAVRRRVAGVAVAESREIGAFSHQLRIEAACRLGSIGAISGVHTKAMARRRARLRR